VPKPTPKVPPDEMQARLAKFLSEPEPMPMPRAPVLPRHVALKIANYAGVPKHERESFCKDLSDRALRFWKRRALSSPKQSPALISAAQKARALHKQFYSLNEEDRKRIENIRDSAAQFEAGEIRHLESTILNLTTLFNDAAGRASPLPPHLAKKSGRRIKDQILREVVFALLSAAAEARGEFTSNKNTQKGTLFDALDALRPHLPKGAVPNALPFATIQTLKVEFFRLRR
jgi:hypothetical protein